MAIPQSFKEKYSLTGESYEKRNVDLALSDLFAASTRLFADNSELRRQIDDLKAERNSLAAQLREAKAAPAPAPLSESSTTIRKLEEICLRLDALESKIGANAGVLGEKLSAIAEALCDTAVYTAANAPVSADEATVEVAEEDRSPEAASAAVRTVTVEPTLDFSAPIEGETAEDVIAEDIIAKEDIIEENIIGDAAAESVEPSREEIIKAAGLEDAAEAIEPSEPIPDDNVAKMLAALYAAPAEDAPTEDAPAEDAPSDEAPAADNGKVSSMRHSLDAIRRRREMKK
jgi:hypothetical protein